MTEQQPKTAPTHTLTVAYSQGHAEDDPDFDLTLTCSDPAACPGWVECDGDHSAATEQDHDDALDGEEVMLHGVAHEHHYGFGWTVPFEGCAVVANDWSDYAWDIARDHGPGEHLVEPDWDDDLVGLILTEDAR